jgi:hypothetical protein
MTTAVTRGAARRIRAFTLGSWALGAVAIAAIAGATAFQVVPGLVTIPGMTEPAVSAWLQQDPPGAVTSDGVTWTGTDRSAFLDVPADLAGGPVVVTLAGGSEYLAVEISPTGWTASAPAADDVGAVTTLDPALVVVTAPGSRLWLTSFGDEPAGSAWTVRLERLPVTDVAGPEHSGSGDADVRYTGDALAGTLVQTGSGLLGVDVFSLGMPPETYTGVDAATIRLLWAPGSPPVFRIRSDEGAAQWTLRIDGEGGAP